MTIQEAIQSRRPFKREFQRDEYWIKPPDWPGQYLKYMDNIDHAIFTSEDILATDWEIKDDLP